MPSPGCKRSAHTLSPRGGGAAFCATLGCASAVPDTTETAAQRFHIFRPILIRSPGVCLAYVNQRAVAQESSGRARTDNRANARAIPERTLFVHRRLAAPCSNAGAPTICHGSRAGSTDRRRAPVGAAALPRFETRTAVGHARRPRSTNSGSARAAISSPQSVCAAILG